MVANDSTQIMNMILSNNEEMFHIGITKDADSFDKLWNKYWKHDAIIMRPSGKIMTKDEWKDIVLKSTDVVVNFSNVLSVDNIHFFNNGKAAVANYTSHEKFTFNNAENDDITKRCIVLEKQDDGNWLFVHGHVPVYVGICPSEPKPMPTHPDPTPPI